MKNNNQTIYRKTMFNHSELKNFEIYCFIHKNNIEIINVEEINQNYVLIEYNETIIKEKKKKINKQKQRQKKIKK